MIRFDCDYTEGAHPRILEALVRTNLEQTAGYGMDTHCERARALIRRACGREDADVHFLVGGTQCNLTVISSILRPHQGVLCAATGHINCHETGAIEATGHKVLPLEGCEGKLSAEQVRRACDGHWGDETHEHIVQPGLVYISQPTEYGTLYSMEELRALYDSCRALALPLFVDGARLGYGLAADAELSLAALAGVCDVFYIGGTKVGMLFGEAVVILNEKLRRDFRYIMKQKGAMLAKGRLLGLQFETMFEDGLYYQVSAHAVGMAQRIRTALREKGIPVLFESKTNQLFPIFTHAQRTVLAQRYAFSYWQRVDAQRDAMRICTSWATSEEHVRALIRDILAL